MKARAEQLKREEELGTLVDVMSARAGNHQIYHATFQRWADGRKVVIALEGPVNSMPLSARVTKDGRVARRRAQNAPYQVPRPRPAADTPIPAHDPVQPAQATPERDPAPAGQDGMPVPARAETVPDGMFAPPANCGTAGKRAKAEGVDERVPPLENGMHIATPDRYYGEYRDAYPSGTSTTSTDGTMISHMAVSVCLLLIA